MLRYMQCFVLLSMWTGVKGYCRGGCYSNGVCYQHGDSWQDDCTTKRCRQLSHNNAVIENLRTLCKDAYGTCKSHGEVMTVNNGGYAIQCKCIVGHASWDYTDCSQLNPTVPNPKGCNGCEIDGVCRSFGERFLKDCYTYECRQLGDTWRGDVVRGGCKDANNYCRNEGETYSIVKDGRLIDNCKCTIGGADVYYHCDAPIPSPSSWGCTGCQADGVCHGINTRWTSSCSIYECRREGFWKITEQVGTQCTDAYGQCKNSGEVMSYALGGYLYNNCVCQIIGLHRHVSCSHVIQSTLLL